MAEQQNAQQKPQSQFSIQRVYVKDLSFESPKAPELFRIQWQPEVGLDLGSRHTQLDENVYEVTLKLTVTAKNGTETAFVAEVEQAGIFMVAGLDQAQLAHTLGSFCPSILFPYAREAIDNMVGRGSFPPVMLAPINFDALFAQSQQREQAPASVN